MKPHEFQTPVVHEIVVERAVPGNDTFNSPEEPDDDYSEGIAKFAKRLARQAIDEA